VGVLQNDGLSHESCRLLGHDNVGLFRVYDDAVDLRCDELGCRPICHAVQPGACGGSEDDKVAIWREGALIQRRQRGDDRGPGLGDRAEFAEAKGGSRRGRAHDKDVSRIACVHADAGLVRDDWIWNNEELVFQRWVEERDAVGAGDPEAGAIRCLRG